jgi:hypothetical protein
MVSIRKYDGPCSRSISRGELVPYDENMESTYSLTRLVEPRVLWSHSGTGESSSGS